MSIRLADPRPESSELQTESPTPSRLWGDQWLRVSEKVLKGLNLEFTDRVAALQALVGQLADGSATPATTAVRSLGREIDRLNHLLQLFRAMPAEPFVVTEPMRLQDVVPQVLDLHGHHADLKRIPVALDAQADVSPVLVRPSALLRCLLVLLESAAGNALRSGCAAAIDMSYGGDATRIFVRFEGPAPGGTLLFTGDGSLVHAVRTALAHAHGTADAQMTAGAPCARIRYEVVLPTLAESRRLESEGKL
jgi:hypothetical protein